MGARVKSRLSQIGRLLSDKWVVLAASWIGFLALTLSFHASGKPSVVTNPDFYAVVAQIIPILLLAAAIEGRIFRVRDNSRYVQVSICGSLAWIIIGEAACLT